MSLALVQLAPVQPSGCSRAQETFSGLPGHPPKRPLAPSPIDLGAIGDFGGVPGNQGRKTRVFSANRFGRISPISVANRRAI